MVFRRNLNDAFKENPHSGNGYGVGAAYSPDAALNEAIGLDDLTDVDLGAPPYDNLVLKYDPTPGVWKAMADTGGGGGGAYIDANGDLIITDASWIDANGDLQVPTG